jgi:Undecaprenyl-phosphate galactose phosphotransferase WbaP
LPQRSEQGSMVTNSFKNFSNVVLLLFIDALAFYSSLVIAFHTRTFLNTVFPGLVVLDFSLLHFLKIWWMPAIVVSFIAYERLYNKKIPFWDETRELLKAVSIATITILALITLGKMTGQISRLTVLFLWGYGLFLFPLFRLIGKGVLYKSGLWKENVIIIGAGPAGIETAKGIHSELFLGYNLIGFLDDDDKIGTEIEIDGKSYKIFGKTKHFTKFVNLLNISTIIIALPSLPVDKLAELTNNVQKHAKNILLIPDVKGIALTNTELYHLFMEQLFLLKINNNLKSPFNRFLKRTFDLMLSTLLLPVLLPAIAIIGLLIKLDSRGPVFHIQDRFGKKRSVFKCMKFRTMYLNGDDLLNDHLQSNPDTAIEWQKYKKLRDVDPRVTKIGRFLRQTSLDELPQIFNVLLGEMSLVGSRPYLPREEDDMKCCIDTILLTSPGITGLWQVSGRNKLTFDTRLRLDTWYVLNWSVWLDIVILFKTFKVVLFKEGAY